MRNPCLAHLKRLPIALTVGLLAVPFPARADSTSNFAARTLTLSHGTLRFDAGAPERGLLDRGNYTGGLGLSASSTRGVAFYRNSEDLKVTALNLGLAYGITDNFEVGGLLLPLLFARAGDASDSEFGNIELYTRYRVIHAGALELGLHAGFDLPTLQDSGQNFGLELAAPINLRFARKVRFETGLAFETLFRDAQNVVNLDIPAALAFALGRAWHLGVRAGARFLAVNVDTIGGIPLGTFAGYTLPIASQSSVDLSMAFTWPRFVTFGNGDSEVVSGYWVLQAGANFYFDVL